MTCPGLENVALYFFSAAAQVWAALAVLALVVLREEIRNARTQYFETRTRLHGIYTSLYQTAFTQIFGYFDHRADAKADMERVGIARDMLVEGIFDDEVFERVVEIFSDAKLFATSWGLSIYGKTSLAITMSGDQIGPLFDTVARRLRDARNSPAMRTSEQIQNFGFAAIAGNLFCVGSSLLPCFGIGAVLSVGVLLNGWAGWRVLKFLQSTGRNPVTSVTSKAEGDP